MTGSESATPRCSRSTTRSSARTRSRSRAAPCSRARSTRPARRWNQLRDQDGKLREPERRADFRKDRRQQRREGDLLLDPADLRLRRAALPAQVRDSGPDRPLPRHPDHRRGLLAHRPGGDKRNGRRFPDHSGLLALRHDHRLRPNSREPAADAARCLLADRQPLDERGADAIAGDELLDPDRRRVPVDVRGATLKDFAFAMLIGIASGTYSSIFIASPVLTAWKEQEPELRARRQRIATATGAVPAFMEELPVAKLMATKS